MNFQFSPTMPIFHHHSKGCLKTIFAKLGDFCCAQIKRYAAFGMGLWVEENFGVR